MTEYKQEIIVQGQQTEEIKQNLRKLSTILEKIADERDEYLIDEDFEWDTKEQHKLHLHQEDRKRLPLAQKPKTWNWHRIRSRPNTKHGYH